MLKRGIVIYLFVALIQPLQAQFLKSYRMSSKEIKMNGLIKGIHEDDFGYLWLYGTRGISRFNGLQFETLQEIFSDSLKIKGCTSFTTQQGNLWLAIHDEGLFRVNENGKKEAFNDQRSSPETLNIKQLVSIDDYLFVLGEKGLESYKLVKNRLQKTEINIRDRESITSLFSHKESLWLISEHQVCRLNIVDMSIDSYEGLINAKLFTNPDQDLYLSHRPEFTEILRLDSVRNRFRPLGYQPYSAYKKERHFAWLDAQRMLSTPRNEIFFQVADFKNKKIEHINEIDSDLGKERIFNTPFRDSNGRLWLYGESLYLIPNNKHIKSIFRSLKLETISSIVELDSLLFIGTDFFGMSVLTEDGNLIRNYNRSNSSIAKNKINKLVSINKEDICLCFDDSFQFFNKNRGFSTKQDIPGGCQTAIEIGEYVWIGGDNAVFRYNKKTAALRKAPLPRFEDNRANYIEALFHMDDHLFCILERNGYQSVILDQVVVDLSTRMWSLLEDMWITISSTDADLTPSQDLLALATDNGLYLAHIQEEIYDNNGYFVFDKRPVFEHWNISEKTITNVQFKNDSILFASTEDEVIFMNIRSNQSHILGSRDGLSISEISNASGLIDKKGAFYLAGKDGIDKVEIDEFASPKKLKLHLDHVVINGAKKRNIDPANLIVKAGTHVLDLKINIPKNKVGNKHKVQVRFMNDTSWVDLPNHNFQMYNPSPGKLDFEFRAVDSFGNLISETLEVKVFVRDLWYRNHWLWLLSGLFFILILGYFIQRKQGIKNDKRNKEILLQEELARLKLQALNAQMNPHFTFNALSSIQQLISAEQSNTAGKYLSKFSKLLRHALHYSNLDKVRLDDELEFIRNYLDLELLRFENSFEYEIRNAVKDVEKIFIPPFFIQPHVENAIKHGLRREHNNKLQLSISKKDNLLTITIEDNGIGRAAAETESKYSVTNMKKGNQLTHQRIENLNKLQQKASFAVEDVIKGDQVVGTRVKLDFIIEN